MQQRGGLVVVDFIVVLITLLIAGGVGYAMYAAYSSIEQEQKTQPAAVSTSDSEAVELKEYEPAPGTDLELLTIDNGKNGQIDVLIGKF